MLVRMRRWPYIGVRFRPTNAQQRKRMETLSITIDPEFQSLIPALEPEEYQQLEANLLQEGCRDALCLWFNNEEDQHILLDGHNRHAICQRHALPYDVREIALEDRFAAMEWIVANQLGRRNLTPEQKSYLRGKRYNLEKRRDGGHGKQKAVSENQTPLRDKLAKEYHVASSTISADGEFADAVDTLESQVRAEIRQVALKKNSPEEQRATKKQITTAGQAIKKQQVAPLPFMQRAQWATYQVLEGITLLASFPLPEHAALNTFLDQPHIKADDGLQMLRNLKDFSALQRQQLYDKQQSDDPRDRDFVMHIAANKVPSPDPQGGIVSKILSHLADIQQAHRLWRRPFPDEPWITDLDALDSEHITALTHSYTAIQAQIKTHHAERIASYAEAFRAH